MRGVNGRPALGISALPGTRREDRLVVGQRPRSRLVRVADRPAVAREEVEQRRGQLERGDPEPAGGEIRRDELGGAAARQREALARPRAAEPLRRRGAARRPSAPASPGARASRDAARSAVPSARRASSAAGSVADSLTTSRSPGAEVRGQLAEAGVRERLAVARDHQPDRVAREPARLGRLGRLERGRERERERGAHACASASARAA